jgi:hypothetical protein
MCNERCPECKWLRDEYEHATTTQIQLEGKLLSAVSEHDGDLIHLLNPKVETAWRVRTTLLAAIRDHGSLHANQPGAKPELRARPLSPSQRRSAMSGGMGA